MIDILSSCRLCPRQCGANRLKGEKGFCGAGADVRIYNYQLHFGEEPPISGTKGSGTIFFSYCTSRCVYCQNYKFSQLQEGKDIGIDGLAGIMLELQEKGAHNINLVTPTHFVPQIIIAIETARRHGLSIPIVYNTSGYELPETLALLKDMVDIYLPDMRYSSDEMAMKYSSLPNYVHYNREAVKIMYKQGDLIIRHLVLPNGIAGTREIMEFIRNELSPDVHISLMGQFYPVFNASQYPEINRQITKAEYQEALDIILDLGLENGWCQEIPSRLERSPFLGVNFPPM